MLTTRALAHFTGKERDSETGLDYFEARYLSSAQGRFTSPDPLNWLRWQQRDRRVEARSESSRVEQEKNGELGDRQDFRRVLEDPQTLNLYAYVRNNPLAKTDPHGLWEAEGHTDLTRTALQEVGFSPNDQRTVIAANVNVDRFSNQSNDPAHYMPSTGAAAERLINASLERAVTAELRGDHHGAMVALGEGLHTVQDRYAHAEQNAGWKAHAPVVGSAPDNPQRHPQEYNRARQASAAYVKRYQQEVEKRRKEQESRNH